jgi:hypothetical protein
MGKGDRHRKERREALERQEAEARARAEAEAARQAFFASFDPEDSVEGPALPCPECNGFDRRWATAEETAATLRAFDESWDLEHDPDAPDDRRVAVCLDCGSASVVPDL